MSSRRVLKAAEAIREVVSMAILTELRDPRVRDVTVTYVEVAADLRSAKVHVSVMGDEDHQQLSLRGLRNAAGYLQHKVSDRINTRYTPRLRFVLDQGVKKSIEVQKLLRQLLPTEEPAGSSVEDPSPEEACPDDPSATTARPPDDPTEHAPSSPDEAAEEAPD